MTIIEKKTVLEHVFTAAWEVARARKLRDEAAGTSLSEYRKYSKEFDKAFAARQAVEDLAIDLADTVLRDGQSFEFFDWLGLVSDMRALGEDAYHRFPSPIPDTEVFDKFFECLGIRGDYRNVLGTPEEVAKAMA